MKTKLFTLPNFVTLLNLLSGVIGVVSMVSLDSYSALRLSFVLVCAAAVFDFLDGLAARLTHDVSPLGAQLDSLAEMVSFGLLPTLIALKLYYIVGGTGVWSALLLVMPLCAALRLARFNVEAPSASDNSFKGLPVPAVALFVASVGWYAQPLAALTRPWACWMCLACGLLLAVLMISPIRMFSLKIHGWGLRQNALRYVFLLCCFVFVLLTGVLGIALAVALFVLFALICHFVPSKLSSIH